MTDSERKYFSIKYLRVEALYDYNLSMYRNSRNLTYANLAYVYSSQLVLLRQIMDDLGIVLDRKVKV